MAKNADRQRAISAAANCVPLLIRAGEKQFIAARELIMGKLTRPIRSVSPWRFAGGPGGPTDAGESRAAADTVVAASAVRV